MGHLRKVTLISTSACAAVLAGGLMVATPAAGNSLGSGIMGGAVDNVCLLTRGKSVPGIDNPMAQKVLTDAKNKVMNLFKKSPMCIVQTAPQLLLLTGDFLDRSAFHATEGLRFVEQALGRKSELVEEYAELKLFLEETELTAQALDRSVEVTRQVGEKTARIAAELEARIAAGYLDDTVKALLVDARAKLERAAYFHTQASFGVAALVDAFKKASSAEFVQLAQDPRVGVTSDYLQQLPDRLPKVVTNVGKAIAVSTGIDRSADLQAFTDIDDVLDDTRDAGGKDGKAIARDIKKGGTGKGVVVASEASGSSAASDGQTGETGETDGGDDGCKDGKGPLKKLGGLFGRGKDQDRKGCNDG